MYQILVKKTNKNFAFRFRTEKRYLQAPNFEVAFSKIVKLAEEALEDMPEISKETIQEELVNLIETGKSNNIPIIIKEREEGKKVFEITSKTKRYLIQLNKYPVKGEEE